MLVLSREFQLTSRPWKRGTGIKGNLEKERTGELRFSPSTQDTLYLISCKN